MNWRDWLAKYFPRSAYFEMPDGGRHARLWEWFEGLTPGVRPRPRGEYWPRGGAKSSTAELGTVRTGTRMVNHNGEWRPARRFVLYVSGTQDQANNHVEAVREKLESLGIEREVTKHNAPRGWRVDKLRAANGFNVLALGLNAAARGVKLGDYRPDLIILDDVDDRHDSPETVKKKIATITESILPAGSSDCAILFVQNLIHSNSIAAQLENGTSDFLLGREQFPAEPAVHGLKYELVQDGANAAQFKITAGVASWAGQSLETCEQQMNDWGKSAFLREAQHDVHAVEDGLWQRQRDIEPHRIARHELPPLLRIGVAIDPSGSARGDEVGIIGGGVAKINGVMHGYVLADRSLHGSPATWAQQGVDLYHELGADVLLGESNFGGEMVEATIKTAKGAPPVKLVHSSRGKLIRAEPVQGYAEKGQIHHVGVFVDLEREQCTYHPGDDSPGRMDAMVILFNALMPGTGQTFVQRGLDKRTNHSRR